MDLDPLSTLIGTAAALVGSLAFLARAVTPGIVAWVGEDVRARRERREECAECEDERAALRQRVIVLENAIAAYRRTNPEA